MNRIEDTIRTVHGKLAADIAGEYARDLLRLTDYLQARSPLEFTTVRLNRDVRAGECITEKDVQKHSWCVTFKLVNGAPTSTKPRETEAQAEADRKTLLALLEPEWTNVVPVPDATLHVRFDTHLDRDRAYQRYVFEGGRLFTHGHDLGDAKLVSHDGAPIHVLWECK